MGTGPWVTLCARAQSVKPAYRAIQDVTEGGYVEPFEM
jgi:hypothetical protein